MPNRTRIAALLVAALVAGTAIALSLTSAYAGLAGAAYGMYLPVILVQPTDTPTPTAVPTATQPPAITLVSLTSPVSTGDDATLVVKTVPAAPSCFLSYVTPHGTLSQAQGLGLINADGDGVCHWTWKIGTNTYGGTGHVSMSASRANAGYDIVIQ